MIKERTRHQAARMFTHACSVLWGEQWQTLAADALRISRSSVVRYANGEREVPQEVFPLLAQIMDEHVEVLERAKRVLS